MMFTYMVDQQHVINFITQNGRHRDNDVLTSIISFTRNTAEVCTVLSLHISITDSLHCRNKTSLFTTTTGKWGLSPNTAQSKGMLWLHHQPTYLYELLSIYSPTRQLRSSGAGFLMKPKTSIKTSDRAFDVAAATTWNSLPTPVRSATTTSQFTCLLKTHLFTLCWWHNVLPAPVTHHFNDEPRHRYINSWLIDWLIDWWLMRIC